LYKVHQQFLSAFEEQQDVYFANSNPQSDEGEPEIDSDERVSIDNDNHDRSGSEAVDGSCEDEWVSEDDESIVDEMFIQEEWVVEGCVSSDVHTGTSGSNLPISRHPGLHQQMDLDVEVTVSPSSQFPSGLVNIAHENCNNPFKSSAETQSHNDDMECVSRMACFSVVVVIERRFVA